MRVLKGVPLTIGLPKSIEELFERFYKNFRASKTALLRRAPLFADTSAHGRGESGARYVRCAPKKRTAEGKTVRVSLPNHGKKF